VLIEAIVEKYILEHQPGFVQFSFVDINNHKWTVQDKIPVVGIDFYKNISEYPKEVFVPVEIIETYNDNFGKKVCKIKLLYSMETQDGFSEFEVYSEQMSETNN